MPLFKRDVILFHEIGVFVLVWSEVDVDDFVVHRENRRQIWPLKGKIEYVAVEAPVRAEYEQ